MEKKQFKAESQRLLDLMIHSIYTHKEIFLRELLSNCSDAIDKLYYKSLTDNIIIQPLVLIINIIIKYAIHICQCITSIIKKNHRANRWLRVFMLKVYRLFNYGYFR